MYYNVKFNKNFYLALLAVVNVVFFTQCGKMNTTPKMVYETSGGLELENIHDFDAGTQPSLQISDVLQHEGNLFTLTLKDASNTKAVLLVCDKEGDLKVYNEQNQPLILLGTVKQVAPHYALDFKKKLASDGYVSVQGTSVGINYRLRGGGYSDFLRSGKYSLNRSPDDDLDDVDTDSDDISKDDERNLTKIRHEFVQEMNVREGHNIFHHSLKDSLKTKKGGLWHYLFHEGNLSWCDSCLWQKSYDDDDSNNSNNKARLLRTIEAVFLLQKQKKIRKRQVKALQEELKKQHEKEAKEKAQSKKELEDLKTAKTTLEKQGEDEKARLQKELEDLKKEKKTLEKEGEDEKTRLQNELEGLKKEKEEKSKQAKEKLQKTIDELTKAKAALEEEREKARIREQDLEKDKAAYEIC